MIQVTELSKSYGDNLLLDAVSFQMTRGERVGLVGRNGHGKSTLFRMILGEETQDSGEIQLPRDYRLGHLGQHLKFTQPTLLAEGCLGLPKGHEDEAYRVERILSGLGFTPADFQRPPSFFSGGYAIRIALTKVLVSDPDLLLLDEPTNYLDVISIRWLQGFLREWPREMILITHDRDFMDSVTTHTLGIYRKKLRKVRGSTEKLYEQLAEEEEVHEKTRQNVEKKKREMEIFINRFRSKARKASVVQSRIKALEKLPDLEKLTDTPDLDFRFTDAPFPAKYVGEMTDVTFGYPDRDTGGPGPTLLDRLSLVIGKRDRIGVIGPNGRGKSTLLKLIAGELKPLAGTLKFHEAMRPGYFGQTNVDRLSSALTVEEEIGQVDSDLGRTRVRGICGIMMFEGEDALKKIAVLSGGERCRVLLGKILATPTNMLLLDEPTSHLDMQSVEAFMEALEEYPGAVIMVTHSEGVLRRIADRLIIFDGGEVRLFDGGYDLFLEKVGWVEERGSSEGLTAHVTGAKPAAEARKAAINPKELRKLRSEIVQERSKQLGPMKQKMADLETRIMELEEQAAKAEKALVTASEKGDGPEIIRLSKQLQDARAGIETAFADLETAHEAHDRLERDFDVRLADLD